MSVGALHLWVPGDAVFPDADVCGKADAAALRPVRHGGGKRNAAVPRNIQKPHGADAAVRRRFNGDQTVVVRRAARRPLVALAADAGDEAEYQRNTIDVERQTADGDRVRQGCGRRYFIARCLAVLE